ncbi:hypothetical protein SASPL_153675 [Salvia splendens]|uniref:Light-mediated development protein DET1 n=1 Tax=Salvia splendens TaxID=180675 RepID=A0A8X8VYZ2_SALSN|nr:hypothetical protein SASPL_153675 [Salvia splendens]
MWRPEFSSARFLLLLPAPLDDGNYLVTFSRNHQDLVVYRPTWLSFSCREDDCLNRDLPSKANKFESFFTQLYCVTLAASGELICKDFFLYSEKNQYGIFATSTAQIHDAPAVGGAIQGIPSIEKITFHLIRLEDGVILDERVFCNDYINLAHSMGVFLYDDLVAIVSLRYQRIHILQIRDSGDLVDVRSIGEYCREDDELFLNSSSQASGTASSSSKIIQKGMAIPDRNTTQNIGNGLESIHHMPETSFLSGLKQRLLSFILRGIWNEEHDPTSRMQCLKKKFYFHFQDYADLVIWKNSAEDLYTLFELFCDHFHSSSKNSFYMNFLSTHSNNIYALEQLKCNKTKASSCQQFVKKMLATLPFNCQSQSPSPYFDHSLFRYDEKLISATDRHRQSTDHPIKFILRRQPNTLKFKIKPGPESGNSDTRTKKISSFLFHPILPLAISVQQTLFLQPAVVNIHFRR